MTTGSPASSDAASEFREYLRRDWDRWLSEVPELATGVGRREFDDRWTDDTPAGVQARRDHLERSFQELSRFSGASLPKGDRLNFELYEELLSTAREGLGFGHDPTPFRQGSPRFLRMPLNQVDGLHIYAPDYLMMQPRSTSADYEVVLRRFARLGDAFDQQVELLRQGLKAGWSPPKVPLRGVPQQLIDLMPRDAEKSSLFQPFAEFPSSVPERERPALVEAARKTYHDRLVPAVERLHRFVEETYLPQCRTDVGASTLPGGAEWYRFLVQWQTTTRQTPQEIHEVGLAEVGRLKVEMEKVRAQAGFAGTLAEFKTFLRHDPKFVHPTTAAMISAYRSLAKAIDPELARQFGTLPRLPYGVLPIPEYRAPSSPAAYYYAGAPETGRPGYFYVNTYDLPARPTWEMEALTLHEAVPGHHLQLALMGEHDDLPEFRRHTGYTAFIEGWGLYAEGLGSDLGLYQDPYSRFGELSMDAFRSARLVVDTGLHALGWSREQAIDFMRDATGKSETDIVAEIDRYIVWPGQALAYKIGQLKLREARRTAAERLGSKFDVRRFHDFLLAEGGLPFEQLDRELSSWLSGPQ